MILTDALVRGVFRKKGVLKISQNSQENICTRVFFLIRLQPKTCNFIKKRVSGTGVPVN